MRTILQVNNWAFYADGERIWTTRHEGVPIAHPISSLLIGRRHGENWPAATGRDWRPGGSDRTCLRGQACLLAVYHHAVPSTTLRAHYQAVVRMSAAAGKAASLTQTLPATVELKNFEKSYGLDSKRDFRAALLVGNTRAKAVSSVHVETSKNGEIKPEQEDLKRVARAGHVSSESRSAGGAVSQQHVIAERSKMSSTQHVALTWNRNPKLTATDLDSFYESLERNPVWRLTRRAHTHSSIASAKLSRLKPIGPLDVDISYSPSNSAVKPALSGSASEVKADMRTPDYFFEDGDVPISDAPSDSASKSRLEEAHRRAADALQIAADPGGRGLWERATLYTLLALPHHLACAGSWSRLVTVLGSPSFLGQMIQEFGSDRTKALLANTFTAASAAVRAGSNEAASVARDQLGLLWELVRKHTDEDSSNGRSGKFTEMWEDALQAGLLGAERATHLLRELLADSRRLIAQESPDVQSSISQAAGSGAQRTTSAIHIIGFVQLALRFRLAARLGMDAFVGGGEGTLQAAAEEIETLLNEWAKSDAAEGAANDFGGNVRCGTRFDIVLQSIMKGEADFRGAEVGGAAAFGGRWGTGKDKAAGKTETNVDNLASLYHLFERTPTDSPCTLRVRIRGPFPKSDHACEALRARLLCLTRPASSDQFFSIFLVRLEPFLSKADRNGGCDENWESLAVFSCRCAIIMCRSPAY